jgi:hypothetical protein
MRVFRWYAGRIPRNRAERLVLQNNLPRGTFLIREREADTRKEHHLFFTEHRKNNTGDQYCFSSRPYFVPHSKIYFRLVLISSPTVKTILVFVFVPSFFVIVYVRKIVYFRLRLYFVSNLK